MARAVKRRITVAAVSEPYQNVPLLPALVETLEVMPAIVDLPTVNAETFDFDTFLATQDAVLLATSEGRRILTRLDPLLFAAVYLRRHMTGDKGTVTFADFHLDLVAQAHSWVRPVTAPVGPRDAYIAPRDSGKSTWLYLILPMWAAAHGHVRFAAAFADSADQAEQHLATFKYELGSNSLLREDYPALCKPLRRPGGSTISDRQNQYWSQSGFVFTARGIDAGSLGMKVSDSRPDLIILDDIEPGESQYSALLVAQRLRTVQDVIFPLNNKARVVIVGTVTLPDSLIHQLVKSTRPGETPAQWIVDEQIKAHYYEPIITRDDGTERSCWPERWPIEWLQSQRHTRAFQKNFANSPLGYDGGYWTKEDFVTTPLETATRWILSVDPAVTTNASSDFTGLSIIGYSPTAHRCIVTYASQVKMSGPALRNHLIALVAANPLIKLVLVEVNQGGDLWVSTLHGMPVKVVVVNQSIKKEVRAAAALAFYQRGQVSHVDGLTALEEQMVAFPDAPHDDIVDSVVTGVLKFLGKSKRKTSNLSSASYV